MGPSLQHPLQRALAFFADLSIFDRQLVFGLTVLRKSQTLSLQLPIFPSELDMLSICILKSFMISSIFIISC